MFGVDDFLADVGYYVIVSAIVADFDENWKAFSAFKKLFSYSLLNQQFLAIWYIIKSEDECW